MGKWKGLAINTLILVFLLGISSSMTFSVTENGWAQTKDSMVSPEDEKKDLSQDDKDYQQQEQITKGTSTKKKKPARKNIDGEATDKNHQKWIDIQ